MTELPSRDQDTGRYAGEIAPIWTIGKKLHGGTMVATSAAAATRRLRDTAPGHSGMFPIAASTDFLGAPEPGAVEYEVRIRKTGRQICLVDTSLVQGGRALCTPRSPLGISTIYSGLLGRSVRRYARRAARRRHSVHA
jgi:acyl-CoA thioesterase